MINKKKILICIDCQHDFIDGVLGTLEAQAIVPKVVEKVKSFATEYTPSNIIFTQDTHSPDNYYNTREGKNLPIHHCNENRWGWKIHESIHSELDKINWDIAKGWLGDISKNKDNAMMYLAETYIKKHDFFYDNWRYSIIRIFFYEQGEYEQCMEYVNNKDYKGADLSIELIGLCTDVCVVSNAFAIRQAFPEAEITIDASCCAGTTPEAHKAALMTMKSCQMNIINEDI